MSLCIHGYASGCDTCFPPKPKALVTHALRRTNSKGPGAKFIGTCCQCGTENLPIEATGWPCENIANLTQDEALLIAVKDLS